MEILGCLFSIDCMAFSAFGYPVSYLELVSTVFGLLSVFLAAKGNIWTWPTGIVNEWGFFILFYQVQLYADMFLQVAFFVITLYGWYQWRVKQLTCTPHSMRINKFGMLLLTIVLIAAVFSYIVSELHILLPLVFVEPAAHPFMDSYVAVASISAIWLLARKSIETWILWITVDLLCVWMFFDREIYLVAFEYVVFLLMASYGFMSWRSLLAR